MTAPYNNNNNNSSNSDTSKVANRSSNGGGRSSIRRSSLFTKMRYSFARSRGQRGASVEVLRGTGGADFEGYVNRVIRGDNASDVCGMLLNCCSGASTGKRFLLIKGSSCFVFLDEFGPSPQYAIQLAHLKAEPRGGGDNQTVHLVTTLGDVEYQFDFSDNSLSELFITVVQECAQKGEEMEIKEKLGHTNTLPSRSQSVIFADKVAKDKVKDQPELPISVADLDTGTSGGTHMPTTFY